MWCSYPPDRAAGVTQHTRVPRLLGGQIGEAFLSIGIRGWRLNTEVDLRGFEKIAASRVKV